MKPLGGYQDLRTSTLIRQRSIQGESHVDFLGESEGSLPPPHDSFPMPVKRLMIFGPYQETSYTAITLNPESNFTRREKNHSLFPLKYIDVSRTTCTNLDVKQEKRIDDYWNVDGSKDLSDPWTGFTHLLYIGRKTSRRIYVVQVEINEKTADIQARSFVARNLENNGKEC